MNTITNNAVLLFESDTGDRIRINIPRACINVTEAQAREAMEAMIAGGTIITGVGRPAAIKSAEIITVNRVNLV
jgi:hypothetical protein